MAHAHPHRFHHTSDLMSQDLGLAGERDRPPPLVTMVVGVPREDVEVRAAQPDGRDAHQHVARPRVHARDVA